MPNAFTLQANMTAMYKQQMDNFAKISSVMPKSNETQSTQALAGSKRNFS